MYIGDADAEEVLLRYPNIYYIAAIFYPFGQFCEIAISLISL